MKDEIFDVISEAVEIALKNGQFPIQDFFPNGIEPIKKWANLHQLSTTQKRNFLSACFAFENRADWISHLNELLKKKTGIFKDMNFQEATKEFIKFLNGGIALDVLKQGDIMKKLREQSKDKEKFDKAREDYFNKNTEKIQCLGLRYILDRELRLSALK